MAGSPAQFFKDSGSAVADHALGAKLDSASRRHLEHFADTKAEFAPFENERDTARRIKEDAIARLDVLLSQLKFKLEGKGCQVYFAPGAEDARQYILKVALHNEVRLVVKGKSMTTEEIALNPALQREHIEVLETDLGEYIVQLRGEPPSHIITPAIHLSKEEIGHLFEDKLEVPYTSEPTELTAIARQRMREKFLRADMGIVGVNFAVAETGTLVLVENEGNGRLSTTVPPVLIAVMGIEKVIPGLADLSHFLEILARTATGQKLTTYTSFLNGPRQPGEIDGPDQMHVVILDNGRTDMLADSVMREALYCLRCGACLNVCPVYRHIGGHAYGSTYPGPIGSIVSPNLFGSAAAGHLPFASSLCGACKDICPVKIDIPRLLLHLRWKATRDNAVAWPADARRARSFARRFAWIATHPMWVRTLGKIAAVGARLMAHNGYMKSKISALRGWTKYRDIPVPRHGGNP